MKNLMVMVMANALLTKNLTAMANAQLIMVMENAQLMKNLMVTESAQLMKNLMVTESVQPIQKLIMDMVILVGFTTESVQLIQKLFMDMVVTMENNQTVLYLLLLLLKPSHVHRVFGALLTFSRFSDIYKNTSSYANKSN